MRTKNGFTLVELLIVIVIISILATLTVFGANKIIRDAHDSSRESTATIITESLEEYYEKYGEYPSVKSLVNTVDANTGTAVAKKLGLNPDDLKMPQMPASATNALTAGPTPHDDYITYVASSEDATDTCQTVIDGGCDQFTLQYIKESDGETVTIHSRHGERMSPPTEPTLPTEIADNFNRTGSTLGSTSTGSLPWSALSGSWSTNGTRATTSGSDSSNPVAVVDYGSGDVDASIDISSGGGRDALIIRATDKDNYIRARYYHKSSTTTTSNGCYASGSWQYSGTQYTENNSPGSVFFYSDCGGSYSANQYEYEPYATKKIVVSSTKITCWEGASACYTGYVYTRPGGKNPSSSYTTNTYRVYLQKVVNGSITNISTVNVGSEVSNMRLLASSDSIKLYVNGSTTASESITDSFNQAAHKHGIGRASGGNKSDSALDNFSLAKP